MMISADMYSPPFLCDLRSGGNKKRGEKVRLFSQKGVIYAVKSMGLYRYLLLIYARLYRIYTNDIQNGRGGILGLIYL